MREKLRQALRIALAALLVGLVVFGPKIAWYAKRARTLTVVIVDKTVPFQKYREHAGIPWILRALKLRDGAGRFLETSRDYVGYDPAAKRGTDLTEEHLTAGPGGAADALFIADTYGVYVGDYERPGEVAALERSPKIYGGFTDAEAATIERFAASGKLVVGEFNTFASPTEDKARARLERVFGARWTKWVGRYWPKLEDDNEVPRWVARLYQRIYKKPFWFRGPGFVLVREDRDMVVLEGDSDLGSAVLEQVVTPLGAAAELPPRGGFWFWLDVVEADGADVLYEHVFDLTENGRAKLHAHGIPPRFPALLRKKNVYYFAGDFVDTNLDLGDPQRYGLLAYRRRSLGCGGGSPADESFFWGFYAPIVARLLEANAR